MNISAEKRFLSLLLVFAIVFLLLPITPLAPIKASAATNVDLGIAGLTVEYTVGNSLDTVTKDGTNGLIIKATPTSGTCSNTANKTTVMLTNNSGGDAVLGFNYSQTGGGTVTIDSEAVEGSSSYSTTLSADGSVTITVDSGRDTSNPPTLTLSGISLVSATATYDVTVKYENTLGSVTVDGAAVNSGDVKAGVSASTGVALVATHASGATFFAWIDSDTGETLSTSATYTYNPAKNSTVKAVFTKADGSSLAWFGVAGSLVIYDALDEAIAAAQQASAAYVVLKSSGILAPGTYTIPENIKLLIPYDANNTHSGSDPDTEEISGSSWPTPEPFRILTMSDGAVIKVEKNGSIEVAANHYASHGGKDFGGRPVHYYGQIVMQGLSRIELESGANLYAWGYITGSTDAKVIAKSGSTIYEKMQVADYRGGSATTPITSAGVFPFSQYYIQNVEVKEVIQSGANLICHAAIYAYRIQNNTVNFMGASSGDSSPMFALGANSEAVKYYDPTTDRLIVDVNGSFSFNSISLLGYNTKDFVLPLQQNLTINIESGTIATVNQDIMLQPGCQINIAEGATLKVASGKNVYLMDTAEWGTFCSASPRQLVQITYVPSTSNKLPVTRTLNNDAKVDVNGTVIIEGQIYASAGHASIVSSGETGVITFTSAVNATTSIKQCKTNDKNGVFEIPMYSVVLTNTDGTTVDTTGTAAGTIYYFHCDIWQTGEIDAAKAPTCTETGLTEGRHCSKCNDVLLAQKNVDALGHDLVNHEAKAPTCTEIGWDAYQTCSRCDYTSYVEKAALGHSYDAVVTAPTCTEQGYTTYTCSVCDHSYKDAYVDALGHTPGEAVKENDTAPTCTEDGSYDNVVYCTVCNAEISRDTVTVPAPGHSYNAVVTDPTCTEQGYTTHTCSVCGDSYTDSVTEALGHEFENRECIRGDAKIGDVDNDGEIAVADWVRLRKYILDCAVLTDEEFVFADFNGDGEISIADCVAIRAYLLANAL